MEPRCAALDGLRGVAILLVLAAQYWANVPHDRDGVLAAGWSWLNGNGDVGAVLFFVLSGFWIARGLIRQRGCAGFFGRYFFRRACRILPVYGLLLGGALVAARILFPLDADLWELAVSEHLPRWSHAVFMQNIYMALTGSYGCGWLAPTWALAVQVQFYLLMPVVVWLVEPRRLPVVAGLAIVCSWAFRGFVQADDAHRLLAALTLPGRADSLFLGVLVACAWEHEQARAWLRRHRRAVLPAACGAGASFVLLSNGIPTGAWQAELLVVSSAVLSLGVAGVIVHLLTCEDARLDRLLASQPFVFWGGISFCVYLAHQPVNSLLHGLVLRDWPQTTTLSGMAVTLGSVLVVAMLGAISRVWLEGPIVVWARRVSAGWRRAGPVAPEAMPEGYSPPLVRWTRGLVTAAGRPTRRVSRVVVRTR